MTDIATSHTNYILPPEDFDKAAKKLGDALRSKVKGTGELWKPLLRHYLIQGYSRAEIANALAVETGYAINRNMVVGKVRDLKLNGLGQMRGSNQLKPTYKATHVYAGGKVQPQKQTAASKPRVTPKAAAAQAAKAPPPQSSAHQPKVVSAPDAGPEMRNITLDQIHEEEDKVNIGLCRFSDDNGHFCGCQTQRKPDGQWRSYCEGHRRLLTKPAGKRPSKDSRPNLRRDRFNFGHTNY